MDKEKGNALFLILIAVALFAALSYAITQSGRGGGSIDREEAQIAATQFLDQANLYHNTIMRMMAAYGVDETELSFVNDVWPSFLNGAAQYENPNCITDTCKVFHDAGGGGLYQFPPDKLVFQPLTNPYTHFSASFYIPGVGADNRADLIAAFRVNQDTCVRINNALGIDNPGGAPPEIPGSAGSFNSPFKGTFNTSAMNAFNTMPAEVTGLFAGCVNQDHGFYSGDFAWFYSVILPR